MNFMLNKLNFLLSKKQRGSLIYITILLFFGMVLEIFGLGVIVPMLTFILEPDSLGQFLKNSIFIKNIGITNQSNFLYFFLIGIVLLYVIKTIVIIYLVYKQNRFITDLYSDFSVNLFNSYINQNYSFHLNKNSSILVKNIQVEGVSGGNLVKVTLSGDYELKSIFISENVKKENQEIINDLIIAAYNIAIDNLKKKSAEELAKVTGGLNLPLDFKLPF